ncbi:hypothetical protein [Pedobacter nototheniae]|uniref:hypothetical protein n=1 Tax=Pedobacter nototheniae TaxID=2488994 RepID=UPI00292FF03E|nr:hypothetical protein [Pedobacter nototheniae]
MKKVILLAAVAACLAFSQTKAQTVGGIGLNEIRSEYIDVSELRSTFGGKTFILLEHGQKINSSDDAVIKDDNEKRLEYKSALEFISKMSSYGYDLFQVYAVGTNKDVNERHYILKKKS